MEFASANETNVADLYGRVMFPGAAFPGAWLPQGVPVGRTLCGQLLAEGVVVSHQGTDSSATEGNDVGGE